MIIGSWVWALNVDKCTVHPDSVLMHKFSVSIESSTTTEPPGRRGGQCCTLVSCTHQDANYCSIGIYPLCLVDPILKTVTIVASPRLVITRRVSATYKIATALCEGDLYSAGLLQKRNFSTGVISWIRQDALRYFLPARVPDWRQFPSLALRSRLKPLTRLESVGSFASRITSSSGCF